MTSEDYRMLEIAISNFVFCIDCKFYDYKEGVCTRFKRNVDYYKGTIYCDDADGCTFGVIRKDE